MGIRLIFAVIAIIKMAIALSAAITFQGEESGKFTRALMAYVAADLVASILHSIEPVTKIDDHTASEQSAD